LYGRNKRKTKKKQSDGSEKEPFLIDEAKTGEKIETYEEKEVKKIQEEESKIPYSYIIVISSIFAILLVIVVFIGGKGAISIVGVTSCSIPFWILFSLPFPIIITFIVLFAFYLLRVTQKKVSINFPFIKGDVKWSFLNLTLFPSLFLCAGFFASLLGIGSGMFKSPILVELGLEQLPAAATSTYMIFYTSLFTVTQYTFLGRMPPDYALWLGITGFIAALIGRYVILSFVKKYKMQSIMVFLSAFVTALSILLMGGVGIWRLIKEVQSGQYLGFKTPCQ